MPKLSYSPICNIPIEFLEFHAISDSFCAGVQLSPYLYGSWLAASYPFLHYIYIDCLFINSIFAQTIEYETPFLKIYLNIKKTPEQNCSGVDFGCLWMQIAVNELRRFFKRFVFPRHAIGHVADDQSPGAWLTLNDKRFAVFGVEGLGNAHAAIFEKRG